MVTIETISIVFTGISISLAAFYYINTLRNTRRNQELQLETRQAQLFMTLFNTIYNQDIWQLIDEIRNYSFTDYNDFLEKYGPVNNPDAYAKLNNVFWLFTEMGNLVYRGLITLRDAGHLMGSSPISIWRKYGPIIEGLRVDYYSTKAGHLSFEYLAKNMMHRIETGETDLYVETMKKAIPDIEIT